MISYIRHSQDAQWLLLRNEVSLVMVIHWTRYISLSQCSRWPSPGVNGRGVEYDPFSSNDVIFGFFLKFDCSSFENHSGHQMFFEQHPFSSAVNLHAVSRDHFFGLITITWPFQRQFAGMWIAEGKLLSPVIDKLFYTHCEVTSTCGLVSLMKYHERYLTPQWGGLLLTGVIFNHLLIWLFRLSDVTYLCIILKSSFSSNTSILTVFLFHFLLTSKSV